MEHVAIAEPSAVTFSPERYWENRLAADYTLAGVGWQKLGHAFNVAAYAIRRRAFLRAARALPHEWTGNWGAVRALDVGAGTGFYIDRLRELGVREVDAVDLTATAVRELRRRHAQDLQEGTMRIERADVTTRGSLALRPPYDLVTAMDVLFHIVDDASYQQALGNLRSVVAPGGHLVLSETRAPTAAGWRTVHQVARHDGTLRAWMEAAGFRVVRRSPLFVLMNTPLAAPAWMRYAWLAMMAPPVVLPALGRAWGAVLSPLEERLILGDRTYSTEIWVLEAV